MKVRAALILLAFSAALAASPAGAQTLSGCAATTRDDPPRTVYECAGGVTLEAEAAALLGITDGAADRRPEEAELTSEGVYIEVDPAIGPFQIRTPHAIAAVRGTVFVVDVDADTTSVFVREGEVAVSHADGSGTVVLSPGLGVDVTPGTPLETRRWPAPRVEALLARFAR